MHEMYELWKNFNDDSFNNLIGYYVF
jgi:hypothetical protein